MNQTPRLAMLSLSLLICLHITTHSLASVVRQLGNLTCTDMRTFTSISTLEQLNGTWYVIGKSGFSLETWTLSCYTWNITSTPKRATVQENLYLTSDAGVKASLNSFNIIPMGQDYDVKLPGAGVETSSETFLIGETANVSVIIKCDESGLSPPYIIALARSASEGSYNGVLSTFNIPPSDSYDITPLNSTNCGPDKNSTTTIITISSFSSSNTNLNNNVQVTGGIF